MCSSSAFRFSSHSWYHATFSKWSNQARMSSVGSPKKDHGLILQSFCFSGLVVNCGWLVNQFMSVWFVWFTWIIMVVMAWNMWSFGRLGVCCSMNSGCILMQLLSNSNFCISMCGFVALLRGLGSKDSVVSRPLFYYDSDLFGISVLLLRRFFMNCPSVPPMWCTP